MRHRFIKISSENKKTPLSPSFYRTKTKISAVPPEIGKKPTLSNTNIFFRFDNGPAPTAITCKKSFPAVLMSPFTFIKVTAFPSSAALFKPS